MSTKLSTSDKFPGNQQLSGIKISLSLCRASQMAVPTVLLSSFRKSIFVRFVATLFCSFPDPASLSTILLIKLGGLFQSKVTNWIEVDFSEWYKNTPNYNVFNLIKNAIFNQNMITFSYFAQEGNYSNRTVEPIKLIFKNKDWYLYGFCLLRNDFRFFKLTRIKDLEISSDTFRRAVENIPKVETVIKNKNFIHAKLKFSPKVAFRVYDEFTDDVSKDNQGNLYVNIDLPDNETLFSYILSFGDNIEILEPDYLRHSMKEKLALMLEKYIT